MTTATKPWVVIPTTKLQNLLQKISKGLHKNQYAISTQIGLRFDSKSAILTLGVTDRINYVMVQEFDVSGLDFNITVSFEIFNKLIQKITTENVTLTVDTPKLVVKGNGKYHIDLLMEPDGDEPQMFPDFPTPLGNGVGTLSIQTLKEVGQALKAARTEDTNEYVLTGYYFNNKAVTTNQILMAIHDTKLFETSFLMSPELMDTLSSLTIPEVTVYRENNRIWFISEAISIYAEEMENAEMYEAAYERIMEADAAKCPSFCYVESDDLLEAIKRLKIVEAAYSKSVVHVTFVPEGVTLKSEDNSGVETVSYSSDLFNSIYETFLDLNMLEDVVKSHGGTTLRPKELTIEYGAETVVRINSGEITHILTVVEGEG